jgi:hypothetical protein
MKLGGSARVKRAGLLAAALAATLGLGGCAQLSALSDSLNVFGTSTHDPETVYTEVGRGMGTLSFDFELDNKTERDSSQVGSGYIVVQRDGKELQALPHAFEMAPEQLDSKAWLVFDDFNGDGFMDFKVAKSAATDKQLPLDSVYQFDRKTGKFVLVDALSGVGLVNATTPGCVSLGLLTASGEPKQESLCFATASSQWMFAKPGAGRDQLAKALAEPQCDPLAPSVKPCQKARIQVEARLRSLMAEYRAGKKQSLQKEQGKRYADAYGKTFDWDYLSWRRFRDARCAMQARENAVSPKDLPAATALCRFDWTRDQLRRYEEQVARLGHQD